jgi:hypothetical protein
VMLCHNTSPLGAAGGTLELSPPQGFGEATSIEC